MGARGEAFSGTTIKDTWTKSRGLEAREGDGDAWGLRKVWEENADNCT